MIERLRARNEWIFAGVLPRADHALAIGWWILLVLRGLLPAIFAVAMGRLVGSIQRGGDLAAPLSLVGMKATILRAASLRERIEHQDLDDLARRARQSADAHEGRRAMLEKRKPRFRGE